MKNTPEIIIVLGQTATGKSNLAVALAKKVDGEIISADSRQIYKGLDIGSGKITKREMSGIPHYLLDIASPKKVFSVSQYQKKANSKIEDILKRNKTPIICGGTGFYIDSIVKNETFPNVPPNKKLRNELNNKNTEELFKTLKKIDPIRAKNIDPKNKVRLIRALEIIETLGKVPKNKKSKSKYIFKKIGLFLPEEKLREKISLRLKKRLKQGMIKEVENLHTNGVSWKRLESFGLEYKYIALYLQKKIQKNEMLKKLETEIYRYAKRQLTWFKRDKEIKWFEGFDKKEIEKYNI